MKTTVVTTTIYVPKFLKGYERNALHHGQEVDFIVIADKKTPSGAEEFCKGIKNCEYVTPEAQDRYLERFPALKKHLPWNTIARRNVGHLMAYESGADSTIMLDDDNFSTAHDFVGYHQVGLEKKLPLFESNNGWVNVADALIEKNDVGFYPRGFPQKKKWQDTIYTGQESDRIVAVNAGLWLNDPDIDAITRIERHLITTDYNDGWPKVFGLVPGTWSPWNCQNTAISRAALVSYFLSPYTGRHLDIWASYITTRIAEHLGEVISFGGPLSYHDRSEHNLYRDLEQEMPWIEQTDGFCDFLRIVKVEGQSYGQALDSVIDGIKKLQPVSDRWMTKVWTKEYVDGLRAWREAFDTLENK